MRYTCQIKRYLSLFSVLALTAGVLIGCTRADSGISTQNASGSQGTVGQSTVEGGTLAGAGSQQQSDGQTSTAAASDQTSASGSQAQEVSGQTTQNVSGTTTQTADTSQSSGTGQAQTNAQAAAEAQPAADVQSVSDQSQEEPVVITNEQMAAEEALPDIFSGEYIRSDGGESVTVGLMSGNVISFAFANSGISSTAQISGNTAVYSGDDGYSIYFDFAGNTLGVSASSPDGGQSSMDGIYDRVVDGGNSVDDNEGEPDAGVYEDIPDDGEDDFVDISAQ